MTHQRSDQVRRCSDWLKFNQESFQDHPKPCKLMITLKRCIQAPEIWRLRSDILECRSSSKVKIRKVKLVFRQLQAWETCTRKVQLFTSEFKSSSCLSEIRFKKCLITQTNFQWPTWLIPTRTRYRMPTLNQSTNIWAKSELSKSRIATWAQRRNNTLYFKNSRKSSQSSNNASSALNCNKFVMSWEKRMSSSDFNFRSATNKNGTSRDK